MRSVLTTLLFIALATQWVLADDFGPRGDIHEIRFVAQRLLAHGARDSKMNPNTIRLSDVVVVKDSALLSWDIGPEHGLMGLIRQYNRWWDALDKTSAHPPPARACSWQTVVTYPLRANDWNNQDASPPASRSLIGYGMPAETADAASLHNEDVKNANSLAHNGDSSRLRIECLIDRVRGWSQITASGGYAIESRQKLSGYSIFIKFPQNNTLVYTTPTLYARAPTPAEFLPYPTTFQFLSTAVLYFDLTIDGTAPVKFQPGTTIDIWFPFVLDDTLKYDLTIGFADAPIGPIYAKPFDNVLHYTLPAFTATPGRTLMAEIDGNWP